MTTEKAIYQLTDLIKDRESFCHRDDFDDMFLQDIEALKVGISALEKQVPKKVKREFATMGGCITCFETTVCPTCSENFEQQTFRSRRRVSAYESYRSRYPYGVYFDESFLGGF